MAPRNVRPAFMVATADGRTSPAVRIGPTRGAMFLSGEVTLRTPAGAVSNPPVMFDAGGRDDRGAARMALAVPAGYTVEILDPRGEPWRPGPGEFGALSGSLRIVIRPA